MPTKSASPRPSGPYGAVLADGSEYRGDYGIGPGTAHRLPHRTSRDPRRLGSPTCWRARPSRAHPEAGALAAALAGLSTPPVWISFSCPDDAETSAGDPIEDRRSRPCSAYGAHRGGRYQLHRARTRRPLARTDRRGHRPAARRLRQQRPAMGRRRQLLAGRSRRRPRRGRPRSLGRSRCPTDRRLLRLSGRPGSPRCAPCATTGSTPTPAASPSPDRLGGRGTSGRMVSSFVEPTGETT